MENYHLTSKDEVGPRMRRLLVLSHRYAVDALGRPEPRDGNNRQHKQPHGAHVRAAMQSTLVMLPLAETPWGTQLEQALPVRHKSRKHTHRQHHQNANSLSTSSCGGRITHTHKWNTTHEPTQLSPLERLGFIGDIFVTTGFHIVFNGILIPILAGEKLCLFDAALQGIVSRKLKT